ncbi:MAG: hypothetical protein J6T62_08190 [Fibrobacter sp.]|nr:hypothetical protein [Fibrobacter sp.]
MKKISFLCLVSLLLWACLDSNDPDGLLNISNPDATVPIGFSPSDTQSPSSSEPNEDNSCSSNTDTSASSSSIDNKISSSSELISSSSEISESDFSSSDNPGSSYSSDETSYSSFELGSSSSKTSSSSIKSSSSAQSSSSLELIATEISPIRIQSLGISPNADFSVFVLSGITYIDASDTAAISDSESAPFFTKVDFFLVHVNEQGQKESALLQLQYTSPTMPRETIDFAEMGAKIIDSAKTQCGTFKLFVILKASNNPDINDMFITIDSVEFVRDPIHCPEPGSSSSTIEQVELIQYNGQMKTSTTNGYSFKKGAEVPLKDAQIQVTMDELTGQLTLHGVNGYKVTRYSNVQDHVFDDDWCATFLPPAPAHTTDFKYSPTKLADATDFEKEGFWIVIGPNFDRETADDFYTVALKESELIAGENAAQLEIVYYKK